MRSGAHGDRHARRDPPLTVLAATLTVRCGITLPAATDDEYGLGSSAAVLAKYLAFRAGEIMGGTSHRLTVRLGYVKGLSRSFTSIASEFHLDLQSGTYGATLTGLSPSATYSLWLVDAPEIDEGTCQPEAAHRLAVLTAVSSSAAVGGLLHTDTLPAGFTIDRVVVTPDTASPAGPLAAGSVNVFQKIFLRRLSVLDPGSEALVFTETTPAPVHELPRERRGAERRPAEPQLQHQRGGRRPPGARHRELPD